ncbi:MAG: sugar phosphate nucleotidyltransferase [Patescibacteria group bacterium]|jgi:mannose-1-phosphate guanylyltransferase
MQILILAGGKGTRLWPLSRKKSPKQLQRILSDQSLLQATAERAELFTSAANIFVVVSNEFQLTEVREQLPRLRPEHIFQEPEGRGTAAAISFGVASMVRGGVPANESVLVLSADHLISNPEILAEKILVGLDFLATYPDYLLTLGIVPTYPETGYGYIEVGAELAPGVLSVRRFHEKPDKDAAIGYVTAGNALWNSGMFLWHAETILERIAACNPDLGAIIAATLQGTVTAQTYAAAAVESIDKAVLERDIKLAVLPTPITWTDIGHWQAVRDWQRTATESNTIEGRHIGVNTTRSLVINRSNRLVTTVGVDNLIIIDTGDALLICDANATQDVRALVAAIETTEGEELT